MEKRKVNDGYYKGMEFYLKPEEKKEMARDFLAKKGEKVPPDEEVDVDVYIDDNDTTIAVTVPVEEEPDNE